MAIDKSDIIRGTQILSELVEQVSCIECCKYYMAPETAPCGHSLCHQCWKKRRTCPCCAFPVNRHSVKLNEPLRHLTEHCHNLLDDFMLITSGEVGSENCPLKVVKEWLQRSQNHFSAPVVNSDSLFQEVQCTANQELSTSDIQIHTPTENKISPTTIVHMSVPQDDWDKIETIPETYEIMTDKENIIGPMDIEPFNTPDKEYSINNPRRSSRKKDIKKITTNSTTQENLVNISISKDYDCITDKTSYNGKQNWNNVKRMRKEFRKLTKKNKNKLNVSIEMCKKTQNSGNKVNVESPININEQDCEIDDNTQNNGNGNTLQALSDEQVNNIESNVNVDVIEGNTSDINKPMALSNTYTNKTGSQYDHSLKKNVNMDFSEKDEISVSKSITSDTNNCDFRLKDNKIPFFKKSLLFPNSEGYKPKFNTSNFYIGVDPIANSDDIDISFKIGNTLTKIFFKQKKNDVQIIVNKDFEVQTSLGPYNMFQANDTFHSNSMNVQKKQINVEDNNNIRFQILNDTKNKHEENMQGSSKKFISTKKNTASTDTATAHFEITDNIENELSTNIECENNNKSKLAPMSTLNAVDVKMIRNNDLDIFRSETIKENNFILLKDSEFASSEILMPTIQTKLKTQNNADKREREINSGDDDVDEQIPKKKIKVVAKKVDITNSTPDFNQNSNVDDSVNYDDLMSQVFANIDADIDDIQKSQSNKDKSGHSSNKIIINKNVADGKDINSHNSKSTFYSLENEHCQINSKHDNNAKNSENLFSMIEKHNDSRGTNNKGPASVLEHIEEMLTPVACHNIESLVDCSLEASDALGDGSDKCVVEDTPQKKQIHSKTKDKYYTNKEIGCQSRGLNTGDKISLSSETLASFDETIESTKNNKKNTTIDLVTKKGTAETPLTINKFVSHVMHNSTPVARKSLIFENKKVTNYHDSEETLCPTAESVVRNTQEKEFMYKAFENSPEQIYKPLAMRTNDMLNIKKLCVAGSCLSSNELNTLKYLCAERKWIYVDNYVDDITHLVVAVDDEKKCKRSVKFMCALAAGKWIVSFEWVKKCLIAKKHVDEAQFEAYDYTGEPGPKRSRITKRKIFEGIKFYCMPPFSILDDNILKSLLKDAGGVVVDEVKKVQVTDNTKEPCLLLAEPEHTQEDRYTYLAMESKIVPVNFEWVWNCLGNYTLVPIQELLLCPLSILPKAISKWPASLLSSDVDI